MANRLVLVRHARVSANHIGRLLGSTDAPLDAVGLPQATELAGRMDEFREGRKNLTRRRGDAERTGEKEEGEGVRWFCSPMQRCRQTAQAIAGQTPIEIVDDLREIDFGRWENHRFAELAADDPGLARRWANFSPDLAFPGGESLAGFLQRTAAVAERLARDPADTVLAVSHGGVIRAMICHLLGLEPRNYVLFDIQYAAVVVLRLFDGKGVLVLGNAETAEGRIHG
jgi:broad specificity phosphatase PhoE